jgi:quinol monooxygenase YgiN
VTAIRVVLQANSADAEAVLPSMLEYSSRTRSEAGNLQAEVFRGNEFAENVLLLELWEGAASFDTHWAKVAADSRALEMFAAWQAPYHYGRPSAPRRQGTSGVEIYRQVLYSRVESAWAPSDAAERPASVRFPAWGPVRIVIQGTSEPGPPSPAQLDNAQESRLEPGCVQFENFRSVEYPENTCLMELWTTPEIYDIHWLNRLLQQASRASSGPAAPPPQVERRYGSPGFEWYAHSYYTLVDGIWQPEDTRLRMSTVRW